MEQDRGQVIVGIDQSPTGTGACAGPLDWCPDFEKLRVRMFEGPLGADASDEDRADRNADVARRLVRFCRAVGAVGVAFEGYAFTQSHRAHEIAESCGVMRHELRKHGFEIRTIWVSSCRKLLLGFNPIRKRDGDPKKLIRDAVRAAGAPLIWTLDQTDAFAVMNQEIANRGGRCIASAPRRA